MRSFDELAARLTGLRTWSGDPSYTEIARRISLARAERGLPAAERKPGRVTVYACFQQGRRRIDTELVVDIVRALGVDEAGALAWRQACRVVTGAAKAATVVNVATALPADLPEFTGRDAELAAIDATAAANQATVVAIEGMAGIGKSRLAVHAAHRLLRTGHCRDVQLFVDLRGFDPHQPPADPAAVLGGFLRLLGTAGAEVEQLGLDTRVARLQAALAGRAVLVVLDNAASAVQVAPLVRACRGCLVLITSRRTLPAATRQLPLGVFTPEESVRLLTRFAGADRVAAEPESVARLAELCGHLPLDLSLTGSHLKHKPQWTLVDHVARLESIPRDEAVRPALAVSYGALDPEQQQLFRLLAIHPGRDITVHAAAALGALGLAAAERLLDQLLADHLVQQQEAGRYAFHNLVHSYATRLARDEDAQSVHRQAIGRLLDHYRRTAAAAMTLVAPFEQQSEANLAAPGTAVDLDTEQTAAAWLDRERANLIAAAVHAADLGMTEQTTALSTILGTHLDRGSHWRDAQVLHGRALDTADKAEQGKALIRLAGLDHRMGRFAESLGRFREALVIAGEIGDRAMTGQALNSLGAVSERLGRHEQARDHHLAALEVLRDIGDTSGMAKAHGNLGVVFDSLGDLDSAVHHYEQAMAVFHDTGDRVNESRSLANIGMVNERRGRYEHAEDSHRRALVLIRELGDRDSEACVLSNLGVVCSALGRVDEGIEQVRRAIEIFTEIGDVPGQAHANADLGGMLSRAGRAAEAVAPLAHALALAEELNDPVLVIGVHNSTGDVLRQTGEPAEARQRYQTALDTAREREDVYGAARAREGLGRLLADADERAAAEEHWRGALTDYTRLGVADAERVSALLAG